MRFDAFETCRREEGDERGWIMIDSSIPGKWNSCEIGHGSAEMPINEIARWHNFPRSFSPRFKCPANLVLDQRILLFHVNKTVGASERERERGGGGRERQNRSRKFLCHKTGCKDSRRGS